MTHIDILEEVLHDIKVKFNKGAESHHGDLFDIDPIEEAIQEAIDLIFYLKVLKKKLNDKET